MIGEVPMKIEVSHIPLEEGPAPAGTVPAGDELPDRPRLPAREGLRQSVPDPRRWQGRGLWIRDGVSRRAEGYDPGVLRPARLSRLGAGDVPSADRGEPGPADRGPDQRRPPHAHALRLRNGITSDTDRLPRRLDDQPVGTRSHLPPGHRGGQGIASSSTRWNRAATG